MVDTGTQTDFIKALGVESLDGPEQEKLFARIGQLVFDATLQRVIEEDFDDKKAADFEELLKNKPTDQQVMGFLALNSANFQKIAQEKETSISVLASKSDSNWILNNSLSFHNSKIHAKVSKTYKGRAY